MKRALFDIEANGFEPTATQVHCMSVAFEVDGERTSLERYVGHVEILKALQFIGAWADEMVAHFGIGYDLIVLWKVLGWKVPDRVRIVDTLTLSCLVHPDIIGGHSLEEWGTRLGCPKTDYKAAYIELLPAPENYREGEEWARYNPAMGSYCDQDVEVLCKLHKQLLQDMAGWTWDEASRMEHQFAKDFAVQGLRGVLVDAEHCEQLTNAIVSEMQTIADTVNPLLPPRLQGTVAEIHSVTPPKLLFKKDGTPSSRCLAWFERVECHHDQGGAYIGLWRNKWYNLPSDCPMKPDGTGREPLLKEFPASLSDQQHIKSWLMDMGWSPTMWSYKKAKDDKGKQRYIRGDDGQLVPTWPKFHDKGVLCPNLESITSEFEHVKLVVKWVVYRHRLGFVKSIVEAIRPSGRVSATGQALGTPTSRVTHKVVANTPKADPNVTLGKECRQIFVAPEGRVLVGIDASGLELRMLANRVGRQQLIDMVVNGKKEDGTEIHTYMHNACKEWVRSRNDQKPVTYGWLYGASDKKLGQTAGRGADAEQVGALIREAMITSIEGLEDLMKWCDSRAKTGYFKAMDGRKIEIRMKHATLNTVLQSDGSILIKIATVWMNHMLRKLKLRAFMVIHYHDEVILEAHPGDAQAAGELFIKGLKWAGKRCGVICPLDGEVKIGNSWADIH